MAAQNQAAVETQMEFAVQMTCQSCVEEIKKSLHGKQGVREVFASLEDEIVLVRSALPSSQVQALLESTGKLVVFRGYGGTNQTAASSDHHGAAVAIMKGEGGMIGLARLVQATPTNCLVEGTVDGLRPNTRHSLKIHEFGDISEGCQSCGDVFRIPAPPPAPPPAPSSVGLDGHLGSFVSDAAGRAVFSLSSAHLRVWDLIGRSVVLHSSAELGEELRLMCGIVARSAGLFQNSKKVCTCDGVTIWEEAERNQQLSAQNSARL